MTWGGGGQLNGGARFVTAAYEGTGALQLNGLDGYAEAGVTDLGNTFTVSLWARQSGQGFDQVLMANGLKGTTLDGFTLYLSSWTAKDKAVRFETGNGTGYLRAETAIIPLASERWNHLAAVVDRANGEVHLYVNGFDQTLSGAILSDFRTDTTVLIGKARNSLSWEGQIDDARVYSRALNSNEVLALASIGSNAVAVQALQGVVVRGALAPPRVVLCLNERATGLAVISARQPGRLYDSRGRLVVADRPAAGVYVRGPHTSTKPRSAQSRNGVLR